MSGSHRNLIALALIILALLGGLYAFMRSERTEAPTRMDTMEPLSRSDELSAIEKDLNTTDITVLEGDLEAELNAADVEIDAALKESETVEATERNSMQ